MTAEHRKAMDGLLETLDAEGHQRVERVLAAIKEMSRAEFATLGMGLARLARDMQKAWEQTEKGLPN